MGTLLKRGAEFQLHKRSERDLASDNESKSERESSCRCVRQTVASSQNPHLARQLRTGSSGKRRAALARLSKEQLVSTFLELESGVAALEMQVEAIRKAEEEIA